MALAYTESPTQIAVLAARPEADFLANLNTVLLEAGWVRLGAYSNGSEYQIFSPQGLSVRVRIWNPPVDATYTKPHFALQMISVADPSGTQGLIHRFFAGWTPQFADDNREFTEYHVWANVCSIFIGAVHWNPRGEQPKAVQAGIPYAYGAVSMTPECAAQAPSPELTTEMWFSSGDDAGTYQEFAAGTCAISFRSGYYAMRYSFCVNGELTNFSTNLPSLPVEANLLQLGILKAAPYWNFSPWPYGFLHGDATPLAVNPLLIHNAIIYAELYDAVLLSKPMELEDPETIWETTNGKVSRWKNYMKDKGMFIATFRERAESRCASLLLLKDVTLDFGLDQNVAY